MSVKVRLILLSVALLGIAVVVIEAEISKQAWWHCIHESPNGPSVWETALKSLAKPSADALFIAAPTLPSLIVVAIARRAWVQVLQLAPLFVIILFLLAGSDHPGHDCDRKGSDLGLGIFVSLVLFQLPLGTLSLIGLTLGLLIDLWRNKRVAQNPIT